MTDVRLTALNPEDSTVVPVACNSSGELLVDKGEPEGPDLNVEGDLSVGGSAEFAGSITAAGDVVFTPSAGVAGPGNKIIWTTEAPFLDEVAGIVASRNSSGNAATELLFLTGGGSAGPASTVLTLAATGSAEFAGDVGVGNYAGNAGVEVSPLGAIFCNRSNNSSGLWYGQVNGNTTSSILADGSCNFAGDLVVGSRSKSWMLVEQGGLCHMVEQTRSVDADDADADYPKLRDVFNELDLIEKSLSQVMEKLRLTPPAGWPVWDGSDETQ